MGEELCSGYFRMGWVPATILRFPYVFSAGEVVDFPHFYLSKARQAYGSDHLWEGEERLVLLKEANGRPFKKHVPHLSGRIDVPYVEATPTQGLLSFYEHDLSKARQLLEWEPRFGIITMIDDALAFRRGEDIGVLPA